MKKYTFTFLFLILSIVSIAQEVVSRKVIRIADGDTIIILTAEFNQIKIRLQGIYCTEKNQAFGTRPSNSQRYNVLVKL